MTDDDREPQDPREQTEKASAAQDADASAGRERRSGHDRAAEAVNTASGASAPRNDGGPVSDGPLTPGGDSEREATPAERAAAEAHAGTMTALFIRRPILALVLNILIVVAGLAAVFGVEIRELPDVDRPVISVNTDFDGASPETMDREVTEVIEGAVSRVAGIKTISSTSSLGQSRVSIEFNDGIDLNVAASDTRDALGRITNDLPDGIDEPRIVKADANAQPVLRLAMTSSNMSTEDLTVLAEDTVVDRLSSVPGVADVQLYGDRDKIFLVDIDQKKMAARGITAADLVRALSNASFDVPAGSLRNSNQALQVRATADVQTGEEFEKIFVNDRVRIGDVARVTLGPDIGQTSLKSNGLSGVGLGVVRQAQSNTLDISQGIKDAAAELQSILPKGVNIKVTSDDANFIRGALEEVVRSLVIAVVVVIGVIYLFLLDWRATLIPALTLPVALIGTVAAIYVAGFSLNILTLLAIILATGLVVDDAIVVLENIVRRRSFGLGARASAVLGTDEVFVAVIATTLTLVAVFVPLSFLPGQTGGLFREFGFVLAFSVLLSAVVALSLCPMLASRMLKSADHKSLPLFDRIGGVFSGFYRKTLHFSLDAPLLIITIALVVCGIAFVLFGSIRQELTPPEDRAVALMRVTAPDGVSLDYTQAQMSKIEAGIQPLFESGEVRNMYSISGFGNSTNRGFMVITLAPWSERERTQQEIVKDINAAARKVPGVRSFAVQPNSLGIRGAGNGLQFAITGTDYKQLADVGRKMVQAMEKDPRFGLVELSYKTTQPQLGVTIDRDRATDLGIDIDGLGDAIQAMLDGRKVSTVFVGGRSYDVKLVSTSSPLNDPTDLENVFLKTSDGRIVPISTLATVKEQAVAPQLTREDQLRAVSITANLTPEFALGDAYSEAQRLSQGILSSGNRIIPQAEAATLQENSSGILTTFGFAVIIILLVLAAQFESFISAVIVMATVPVGLACAVFAIILTGGTINVYSQIGLVLLVGIMAKNGILIVEFANQLRDRGYGVRQAVEEAANIRLRPVMMTMIATILGGLPLIIAHGAGAEARAALGWVMVGGLGLAAVSTLYLTPVAFLLLARFSKPRASEQQELLRELDAAAAVEGRLQAMPAE